MEGEKASQMRIMLLLLISLSTLTFSAAMMCPHPEDLYPCRCVMRMPVMLFCGGHNITMPQVQRAFEAMEKSSPGFFSILKNINIGELDINIFNATMIHGIHIEDCIIDGFVDRSSEQGDMPPQPRMIQTLDIHNSIHGDVEINMALFDNVQHLSLSNNVIKNLQIDWPINVMGPMSINLANNSIESVDEDALAPLTGVSILDMSMNRLKNLGKELRPTDAQSLTRLDCSHNLIKTISRYYFQNMPALKYVSLSYNQIQVLSEKTWKLIWPQFDYVNLEENPLSCGKEIKWMQIGRPETVRGTCATPEDKKSKTLSEVIKENNPTENYLPDMLQRNVLLIEKDEKLEQDGFHHYPVHQTLGHYPRF